MSSAAPTLEQAHRPIGSAGGGARLAARAAAGRWSLRGLALIYLGLMVALPTAVLISRGFGHGLGALKDALAAPGAHRALTLTIVLSASTYLTASPGKGEP